MKNHRTITVTLLAAVLLASACGEGATTEAAQGPDPTDGTVTTTTETETEMPTEPTNDQWTVTTTRDDLIQVEPMAPIEVVADPTDPSAVLVHFQGAAEPCSGFDVEVTETEETVEVALFQGLDPNVAAMSCIAQVFDYEITVPLDAPLGDRTVEVVEA